MLQRLFDKKNYVLHYKLLKLYVSLGLIVAKVHRVLQFKQANWLAPYISLNSTKRQAASNKFEENFYKLMNNAVYGKNCESKRRRSTLAIARDTDQVLSSISKFEFDRFMIFRDNLAALSFHARKIYWNTPTMIRATILDLAKYQMYSFHYYTMRAHFDCRLLYSDTDSLLYKIRSTDFYEELARKPASVVSEFDFSNYPNNHYLYSSENKRVVLKFKDEFAGEFITEFVCLKPKLYSILSKSKYSLYILKHVSSIFKLQGF